MGCAPADVDGAGTGETSSTSSSQGSTGSGSSVGSTSSARGEEGSSGGAGSSGLDESGDVDACATDVEPSDTIVLTDRGPVRGAVTEEGGVAFLGIPYAEAPVGARRWAAPEQPACWTETLEATALGPSCPQLESPDGPVVGDEDCLQLNVWTPSVSDGQRPVMVFIHGGGNAVGSGTYPIYDGAALAAAGDVVVVTINYRLGALGWLTHPELPAENFGLRDQIAALEWVQRNASAFGGDAGRVTVFGESAGAVNTCALLGAPAAADLMHGAIVQSGTCNQRSADAYDEQMSAPFLAASGCADDAAPIECLRGLGVDTVVTTEPTGFPSVGGFSGQGWGPSLDPETLPVSTLMAMARGTHNDVPVVIGANAEETWADTPDIEDAQAYEALVNAALGGLADAVLEQYPVEDYPSPRDAYVALTSDARFVCTARQAVRAASNGRSPVYRYHFAHDDYFAPSGETAAFHGLELVYIFGNFDAVIPGIEYPSTAADEVVREAMQFAWSSFAANWVPSTRPGWPVYDEADPFMLIEDPLSTGEGVRTEQCDFWDSLTGG